MEKNIYCGLEKIIKLLDTSMNLIEIGDALIHGDDEKILRIYHNIQDCKKNQLCYKEGKGIRKKRQADVSISNSIGSNIAYKFNTDPTVTIYYNDNKLKWISVVRDNIVFSIYIKNCHLEYYVNGYFLKYIGKNDC